MARVLLVSKPLVPPWNDSSKNLARDVASGLARHLPVALGDGSRAWVPPRGELEPVYRERGRFAPGLSAQLRVLGRLAFGARADLWHFFFAPNPKSSAAGRACAALRRTKTLQTVCSRPKDLSRARSLLFADLTVVLSRATLRDLREAGVPSERLAHVPPAVPPLAPLDAGERRAARETLGLPIDAPIVLFPGDLELGDGAGRVVEAFAGVRSEDALLVMACRPKTGGAQAAERALRERMRALGIAERAVWIGETPHIHALLGAADIVALPSTDLFAKMDLPLVLLEAMWLARPVVVAAGGPAAELADEGAAVAADEGALSATLGELLGDDAARAALGERARRAAEARYHPARMASEYETLYDRVLAT
jgi:glycosyltransferase involved in cell wall biosynthesis